MELNIHAIDRYLVEAKNEAGADWALSVELRYLDWLLREVVRINRATALTTFMSEKPCVCGAVVRLSVRVFCTEVPDV